MFTWNLVIGFIASLLITLFVTPKVKKLAIRVGAIDKPDERKSHIKIMPRLGGLAIVIGFLIGLIIVQPETPYLVGILAGAAAIVLTGVLDDLYTIRPIVKLIGQSVAAISVMLTGLMIETLTVPFFGTVELGGFSLIATFFWIIGISNAINLIDGLDGLAAGVSTIGLFSIFVLAIMDYRIIVVQLSFLLIGSSLGFLYHNFFPAKIFMGDTGSLFLGYMVAVISILGLFKNVAIFSFIVPVIIMAIPIFDTLFAIIRRKISGQKIGAPDKKHIHHRLIDMGYSHRKTVLIIYAFSAFFGLMAVVFSSMTMQFSLFAVIIVIFGIELIAELTGIIPDKQHLILKQMRLIKRKLKR